MLDDPRSRQHGVLARSQALRAGVSPATIRAHLEAGRWQTVVPGVYATFSGPVPRLSYLWAIVLWAGPGAALSHDTAAELVGLLDEPPPEVHVTVPATRTVTRRPGVVVHRAAPVRSRTPTAGSRAP